jgi:hypothetical protein
LSTAGFIFQLLNYQIIHLLNPSISLMSVGGGIGIHRGYAVPVDQKDQNNQYHEQGKRKQGKVPARFGPFSGEYCHC